MIEDISYGIILVLKGERNKFLIIKHNSGGHWSFPKGHKDGDETDLDSALRELKEETGVEDCELFGFPEIWDEYSFENEGEKWHKRVKYFMAFTHDSKITIDESEISEYKWLNFDEAINILTYENSKEILKKAKEYLDEYDRRK